MYTHCTSGCTRITKYRSTTKIVHACTPANVSVTHSPSSSRMLTTTWPGLSTTPGNWAVLVDRVEINLSVASIITSSRIGTVKLSLSLSELNVNGSEKPL